MNWFAVDKKGLAKLMAGRPKAFVLYELIQNAWDQKVTEVAVTISPIMGVPMAEITVADNDPDGFSDLAHAYTLFAESNKKGDANKRGRFNLGEKLVLALAKEATIETRGGAVKFDRTGRHEIKSKRMVGSKVTVILPMTRAEEAELLIAAQKVIVPPNIKTSINAEFIQPRKPLTEFTTTLPTLIADGEGVMKATSRKTIVRIYEPKDGEVAALYEMGIPVVETGDRYHVDVQQKVPLNMDRDNVTPAYLRAVRVAVLNAAHTWLGEEDTRETWVKEACRDERADEDALRWTFALRFGQNAVAYDPSDPEANKLAVVEGRQVIYGGHLSGDEWDNAKRVGVLLPAGKVTPSDKPYDANGKPLNLISEEDWNEEMQDFAHLAKVVARELLDITPRVEYVRDSGWKFAGTYGHGVLTVNLAKAHIFTGMEAALDFLIHEFGHHYCGDHLSENFYKALTRIGARMTFLALKKPECFSC